ncbi:MAG: hypothetical protein OXF25_10980 [Cyanobacteria bacterium MAG CAR3_bin_5]|nr:hypothetical protein [Cyanobacteria bacterium MAG CAR3_bin_5]
MNSPLPRVKTGTVALLWATAPLAALLLFSPAAHPQQHSDVSFSRSSGSVREDGGAHNVTVSLTPAPSSAISLAYTVGGAAKAGTDYTALSGSVTVAAGVSSVTIPVVITEDTVEDGSETIVLTLTDGADYNLGATTVHRLTISDDDVAGVSIRESEGSTVVTEAAGAGRTDTYTVVLASAPRADVSITVTSDRPSAALVSSGGGLAAATTTLRFTPETRSTAQRVTVTGVDDKVEQSGSEDAVIGHRSVSISHSGASSDGNDGISIGAVVVTVVDDDAVTAPVQVAAGEVLPTEPLTVALTAAQETIDEANGRTRLVIALSRVLGEGETATVPYTVTGGVVNDHWNISFPKGANGAGVKRTGSGGHGVVKFNAGEQRATLVLIGRPDGTGWTVP